MRSVLCVCLCLLLAAGSVLAAPALQDTLTFPTFSPDTLMSAQGWRTYYEQTGGFGQPDQDYTYRVAADGLGHRWVVDSYRYAQNHGQGTAILLDWDGDPSNGVTPLQWQRGMTVTFGVSVYLQPYSPNWSLDGTGHVIWSFGPGIFDATQPMVTENTPAKPYDWTAGRGPRVQYRMGYQVEGHDLPQPELRAFSPQSATPALAGKTLPTGSWVDLRLTVAASADGTQADCTVESRPTGETEWQTQGSWTCPLDPTSAGGDNPTKWNALLLDMPLGQWSRKGYGDPTPQMIDALDNFTVAVTPADATGTAKPVQIFQGNRPKIGANLAGPTSMFADDTPSWQVEVINATGGELRGALSLRSDQDHSCTAVLAADLHLADGARGEYSATLPPGAPAGDQKLEVVLRDAAGQEQVVGTTALTVFSQLHPAPGMNLVRNASFELGPIFSGTPMREGAAFFQMFVKDANVMRWTPAGTEGWWVEGPSADGVEVVQNQSHSGGSSLRVSGSTDQPRAVESALNRMVPAGPVTLSAWVKTEGCTGRLDLDLEGGQGQNGWQSTGNPAVRQSVTLPTDSDWTRLTVTATAPSLLQTLARIQVDQGTAWLDDVQIEAAPTASAFNVRPEEWLRFSVAGVDDAVLAKWVHGDKASRQLAVTNDSRVPLTGTVHVYMGSWDHPTAHELATFALKPGTATFAQAFSTADLPVDAYVLALTLDQGGKTIASGLRDFAPEEGVGGSVSNGMLRSRTAVRFAIAPDTPSAQIFGVGNTMLDTNGGSWFGGWTLKAYADARSMKFTTYRTGPGDEKTYLGAAAGVSMAISDRSLDSTPAGDEAVGNPAFPQSLDLSNPAGWAVFLKEAERTGRDFGANPFITDYQMANESPYPNGGHLCPSTYADADFRGWCQKKYGNDLTTLNANWGTSFTSWDQVEQIASASFAEQTKLAPKEGAAATDWMARTGNFSDEIMARMQAHPGWSMDWMRWWTDQSVRMFTAFVAHAHKFDHKTLYGNNLCWPAFWPQMYMPFLRNMDNGQLDVQYTAGMPRGLGTPAEMMDSLEMTESTVPGKPIWGHEIYYQPQWPPEYIAFQSWGLIAHGMTNDLTFAWWPYSDHGTPVGTHAWEKPDAWPMWFIIDNDGTKLPGYYSYARSIKEIQDFHQKFEGLALKRAATTVGFYVSPDTGCYVLYQTGNHPWNSVWQRTRNALGFALRMSGVTLSYVDDATLPAAPGALKTIIVPASYVLSQPAAEKLAAFAKAGGTVILAGMSGVVDPWLNKYQNIGGPAWADLNWQAPDFAVEQANQVFTAPSDTNGPPLFHGTGLGTMPNATPITGPQGATIGWTRSWGQGKLLAYGIVPDAYTGDPHVAPELLAWLDQWRLYADVPFTGRWISGDERKLGTPGLGSEVVEVVVREKSPAEKFVFCLNQGGAGMGKVEVPVGGGNWQATDAITGQAVAGSLAAGTWTAPMSLDAFGYQVLRLVKQ